MAAISIQYQIKTFTDNLYQEVDASKYAQHLVFADNHIAIVISDTSKKQVMQLALLFPVGKGVFELSYDELKASELLMNEITKKYASKKVFVSNEACTLVPESLLNIIETEAYYCLTQKMFDNSQVLDCKMNVLKTAALFNVKNELVKLIRFNMPMVDMIHSSLLFIKLIHQQHFPNPASKIHVHVHGHFIEIAVLDEQLKFYNTFAFGNENDITYFILAVAKQMELNQDAEVLLYGEALLMNELQNLLKSYVKSVSFGIKSKSFTYPVSFHQFEEHQYLIESSTLLCEL